MLYLLKQYKSSIRCSEFLYEYFTLASILKQMLEYVERKVVLSLLHFPPLWLSLPSYDILNPPMNPKGDKP